MISDDYMITLKSLKNGEFPEFCKHFSKCIGTSNLEVLILNIQTSALADPPDGDLVLQDRFSGSCSAIFKMSEGLWTS